VAVAQEVVVGVSLSSDTNPFYIAMRRGMEARATELGWRPRESFETGLDRTVAWYLNNESWWRKLRESYAGQRLGLKDLGLKEKKRS
jgi:hypothetical protein